MSRARRVFETCFVLLLALHPARRRAVPGHDRRHRRDRGRRRRRRLPGATVTLRNTATNFEQTVTSGTDGRFRGLLLPLGPYRVTRRPRRASPPLVREGIDLAVGQTINLHARP